MKVAAVILAGGMGSRIGGNKPRRIFAGQSLLSHMLGHARTAASIVAVAMRDTDQIPLPPAISVIRDAPGEGPMAGLWAAGRFALTRGCDAILSLPCDTPFVPRDLLPRLASVFDGRAALARSGDRLHPVCGLWSSTAFAAGDQIPPDTPRSLLRFAQRLGHTQAAWADTPFDPFFNINTGEQLAEAEHIWQSN